MGHGWQTRVVAAGLAVLLSGGIACSDGPQTIAPLDPPETTLGTVVSSPTAAIIAVGDTLRLAVTGATLTGVPVTEFDSIRYALYTASDSARVHLDRLTGTIVGVAASSGPTHVKVDVFAFKNGAVGGAETLVQVTATRIAGPLTMSVQPPLNGNILTWGVAKAVYPSIRNPVTGDSVRQPVIRYSVGSADTLRVSVYQPYLRLPITINPSQLQIGARVYPAAAVNAILPNVGEGSAWVYGNVTAYGQALRDSARYTFVYPSSATITTAKTNLAVTAYGYQDETLTLSPGGIVTFTNGVSDSMRVAYSFDHPEVATAVGGGASGNIAALGAGETAQRQFLQTGTYQWTAVASNAGAPWDGQSIHGTIVIK